MTIADWTQTILALAALIGAAWSLLRGYKTLPNEMHKGDAELSKQYKELADDSLKDANAAREERNVYRKELEGCCSQIEGLTDKVNVLENTISKKDEYIAYVVNGVKKLCAQMRRKGIPPVFEPMTEEEFEAIR